MYESMRQDATVGFLKCALHPGLYNTPPPSVDLRSDFSKDGTVIGNFVIPSNALVNEMVPYTSGMILWLCNNGIYSVYRQHFVPPGTVSTVGSGTNSQANGLVGPQLDIGMGTFGAPEYAPNQYGIISSLTYGAQLALPVSSGFSVGDQISVNFDPLMTQVAYSRLYAGAIRAVSASTSISTGTVLTGTFTAASVEDTRGVSQDSNGDAFSIGTLTESSETSKDYVAQVPNNQGVAVLLGDDVPIGYTNPLQDQTVIADGQCGVYYNPAQVEIDVNTAAGASNWASTYSVQFSANFISPWNIQATTSAHGVVATVNNIQTFPIGETDALKIKMVVPAAIIQNSPSPTGQVVWRIVALATHIFATVDMTGTIHYACFTEERTLRVGNGLDMWTDGVNIHPHAVTGYTATPPFFTSRVPGTSPQPFQTATEGYGQTVEFDPIQFRQSYTIQGKYLGSYICIAVGASAFQDQIIPALPTVDQGVWIAVGVPFFYVTASGVNLPGRVGPARIIRWDNMGQGMQLAVSGKLWVQSIPTSKLAPFVKQNIMSKSRWCDEAATTLLAALCSGPGPFRRVWVDAEYRRFIEVDLPDMDLAKIASYAVNNDAALSALLDVAPQQFSGSRRGRDE